MMEEVTGRERLHKYLLNRPKDREMFAKKEKELQDIVLRAAEGGYVDIMRQALPLLYRLYPDAKPMLNCCKGKGGSPQWNKQVREHLYILALAIYSPSKEQLLV